MRIISKFKDYYDGPQIFGVDERCMYFRKSEDIEIPDSSLTDLMAKYFNLMRGSLAGLDDYKNFIVGFCGKIYPIWTMSFDTDPRDYVGKEMIFSIKEAAYDADGIEHFLKSHKKLRDGVGKFNSKISRNSNLTRREVNIAVSEIQNSTKLNELFVKYRTPCFVIESFYKNRYFLESKNRLITINPILKDYKFYKVKDTVTAYQEINQYLSGILGLNDKEIVHISDEHMKSQKGFGHKYAFKTLPTKKR